MRAPESDVAVASARLSCIVLQLHRSSHPPGPSPALSYMPTLCQAWSRGDAKGVFALLQTMASPGRCRIHLIHAEEDLLCDCQPNQFERHVVSHRLDYTVVSGSDKWMGTSKHQYLHWLRCQLPLERHDLAALKLRHPEVIPVRDRMAAPLRLASWAPL